MRHTAILLALVALAGCATPEQRLRNGLMDAGLSRPMAECMAPRMADQLTLRQLMRIAELKRLRAARARDMSFDEFLMRTRALRDPQILAVTGRAGLACLID